MPEKLEFAVLLPERQETRWNSLTRTLKAAISKVYFRAVLAGNDGSTCWGQQPHLPSARWPKAYERFTYGTVKLDPVTLAATISDAFDGADECKRGGVDGFHVTPYI